MTFFWAEARLLCLMLTAFIVLTACTPVLSPREAPPETQSAPGFPDSYYQQAQASGVKVLRVDPARSILVIEVRRGGPLAGLGHDHAVASHDVRGYVALERGRADLVVSLAQLTVDEPELRKQAGFTTQPSADAIEGTRRNMLDKVLEVGRFPLALIRIERAGEAKLRVAITLHGVQKQFEVPAQIETKSDGIVASGSIDFKQSDFGIVPFSVLGGALQVQDRVDLRFRIHAGP
jgi:hypothetical protein